MPDTEAQQVEVTESSMAEFEREAGLESNQPAEGETATGGGGGAGESGEEPSRQQEASRGEGRSLEDITAELLDDEGEHDNLRLLEKRKEREKAKAQAEAEEEDEEEEEEAEAEEEEADEEEAEEEEEDEEEAEEEEEEGDEEEAGEELTGPLAEMVEQASAEEAQAALDALIEAHPDLTIPYRANGQDLREPVSEVAKKAAGYAGEGEVTRRFQQAKKAEELAQQTLQKAERIKDQVVKSYGEVLDDPKRLVHDFLMRSDEDFIRTVHNELTGLVTEMEEDPTGFGLRREVGDMKRLLTQLVSGAGQTEAGAGQDPAGGGPDTETTGEETPDAEDFGFIPGRGYPSDQKRLAMRALDTAAAVAGITPEQVDELVIPKWDEEGRRRPVFEVLRDVVHERTAETEKVETAKNPPKRKTPQGNSSNPTGRKREKPRSRRGTASWDDIPGQIVKSLEQAERSSS